MYKSYIIFLFFVTSLLEAQNAEQVFKNVLITFDKSNYLSYNLNYFFYKNHESKQAIETYSGFLKKGGKVIYQKIEGTEFLLSGNTSLKIVNPEKAILLIKNKTAQNQNPFDLKAISQMYKIETLNDKKTHWELELIAKENASTNYGKIKLLVDKNFRLKRQIFYYSTSINFSKKFSDTDIQQPRLEIEISNIKTSPIEMSPYNLNNYIQQTKDGYKPVGKYSKYKLITK